MVPLAPHLLPQLTEQGSPIILPASASRTPSPFFADSLRNGRTGSKQASIVSAVTAAVAATTSAPASHAPPSAAASQQQQQPSLENPIPLSVRCQVRTRIPSEFGGECHVHLYSNTWDDEEHLALVYGDDIVSESLEEFRSGDTDRERMLRGTKGVGQPFAQTSTPPPATTTNGHAHDPPQEDDRAPLVRIHSCCFTGETLRSLRCDCAEQLEEAMRCMAKANRGVVLYLKQEGRGIGLRDKLRAYNLIDLGHDTMAANLLLGHPPDARSYEIASAMLRDLGIDHVRLLTNNPDKMRHLQRDGVVVTERVPMVPASWQQMGMEEDDLDGSVRNLSVASDSTATANNGAGGSEFGPARTPSPLSASSPSPVYRKVPSLNGRSLSGEGTPHRAHSPLSREGTPFRTNSPLSSSSHSSASGMLRLQDRDEYLVTKVQRMGHILDIPHQLLEAVAESHVSGK